MPNHTTNCLCVAYTQANLATICSLFDDKQCQLDFNKIIPIHDTVDWYNANIKGWGVKWNAYNTRLTVADNAIILQFDTAWNVPKPIIKKLTQMFDFEFSWADEDESAWGTEKWEGGERIEQRFSLDEDKRKLYLDLKEYDCEIIEE